MGKQNGPLRVLVVDDSRDFLDTACAWISSRHDFLVQGTAPDGAEALRQIEELQPDLVLMDATMPVLDGFEATRRIRESGSDRWVVIVSFHDSETFRQEAWAAGADGFVSKADLVRTLPGIVRDLREGRGRSGDGIRPGRKPSGEDRPRNHRAPQSGPEGNTMERSAGTEHGIGARLRRWFSFDRFRKPVGGTPAMAISGDFGGTRRRFPKIHKTEV